MFDKQDQSFYCFFFICFCNWSIVFAQEFFLLKGERKKEVGDVFFLVCN